MVAATLTLLPQVRFDLDQKALLRDRSAALQQLADLLESIESAEGVDGKTLLAGTTITI